MTPLAFFINYASLNKR